MRISKQHSSWGSRRSCDRFGMENSRASIYSLHPAADQSPGKGRCVDCLSSSNDRFWYPFIPTMFHSFCCRDDLMRCKGPPKTNETRLLAFHPAMSVGNLLIPNFLFASCCSVDVMKGTGGLRFCRFVSMLAMFQWVPARDVLN